MYIQTLVIVLCAVSVAKTHKYDLKVIDLIYDEKPCLRKGGRCTIAVDCPRGLLEPQIGLCPEQQYKGVECCYGPSVRETRCERRGGYCPRHCKNKRLFDPRGTDCPKNTVCCILV